MMNILLTSASRIARLQESSMVDECRINQYSETSDSYGDIVKSWTSGSSSGSSICGVQTNQGSKTYPHDDIVIKWDALIRLPLSTLVDERDTITVTKQNNQTISDTYTIINSSPSHGQKIVKCQKIQV